MLRLSVEYLTNFLLHKNAIFPNFFTFFELESGVLESFAIRVSGPESECRWKGKTCVFFYFAFVGGERRRDDCSRRRIDVDCAAGALVLASIHSLPDAAAQPGQQRAALAT